MKEILLQYALYNKWANDKMIETVLNLPRELTDKHVESSFSSLRLTISHLWTAESTWWQRLNLSENIIPPPTNDTVTIEAICDGWKKQYVEWLEWVTNVKDMYLNHVFAYRNSKREEFKQPVYQLLLHLFNHETYHRGQMITMLRQLGVEKLPNTDFINWSRSKK